MGPLAVTGIGMLNALGLGRAACWRRLLNGAGGIGPVTAFAVDPGSGNLGAEIKGFNPRETMPVQFYRRLSRLSRLAVAASCEALLDSGVKVTDDNRERIGAIFGSAFGSTQQTDGFFLSLLEHGPQGAEPILFPDTVPNAPASHVAIFHQLQGPNSTLCQNHLSGESALAFAASMLQGRQANALVVGGVDELSPILWHSLNALRAIKSVRQEEPLTPGRMPCGRGFIPGEAATCLVVEPQAGADDRRSEVYGTLLAVRLGGTQTGQGRYPAHHDALADILRAALEEARLQPGEIDLIGLAANGVAALEAVEAGALRIVFGVRWEQIPRIPLRYAVGEFGAAGLLTVATILLALGEGVIPPAIIGPYLTGKPRQAQRFNPARQARLRYGMIIGCSFGGGHSCIIVGC